MIGIVILSGWYAVAITATIASVAGAAILEGLVRLSRCCMSARTVIAQVQQPMTFEQIVQQLIDDDHTEAIEEAGRVQ